MAQVNNHMNTFDALPEQMKQLDHWVCWRPDKVPINPKTGGFAKSNDPETWSNFDTATNAFRDNRTKYSGIGFQFTGSGLIGIDLDHCLNEDEDLTDWGLDVFELVGKTAYHEISPSGDGVHIIMEGEPAAAFNKRGMPDVSDGMDGAIEMYSQGRYFTATGIGEGEIESAPADLREELIEIHAQYAPEETGEEKQASDGGLFSDSPVATTVTLSDAVTTGLMGGAGYSGPHLTEAQVVELLHYIDPDCDFKTWLAVIFAVHSWDETKIGFNLVDDWSSRGEKYIGSDDVETHWRTGDNTKQDGEKATLGTLYYLARKTLKKIAMVQAESVEVGDADELQELMRIIVLLGVDDIHEVKALLCDREVLSPSGFDTALDAEGGTQTWSRDELQQMIDAAGKDDYEEFMKINKRIAVSKLGQVETDILFRSIKVKSGIALGALRSDAAAHIAQAATQGLNIAKDASHGVIANHFISEHTDTDGGVTPVSAGGAYHRFTDGLWAPIEDRKLEVQVAQRYPGEVSRCMTRGDYAALARHCYNITEEPDFFIDAPIGIAMQDGFLILESSGELSMEPLSAAHRQKIRFPFDYDEEDYSTPRWDAFLKRSFAGDDMDAQMLHLQELFGAVLFRLMPAKQLALLIIGPGQSGKSTALFVLEQLLPCAVRCSVSPVKWSDEYYTAALAGKYLNVVGELPEDEYIPAAAFKMVTGGDLLSGRHPGGRPFEFHNEAAHIFNSNFFPQTKDRSNAFFRRWRIVEFANPVPDADVQDNFEQELLTELQGIVAWSIEGAVRLVKNGRFTESATHVRLKQKWMRGSDSVLSYLHDEEYVEFGGGPGDFVTGRSLYADYKEWCIAVGRRHLGQYKFYDRMDSPEVQALGIDKKRNGNERGYSGIKCLSAYGSLANSTLGA